MKNLYIAMTVALLLACEKQEDQIIKGRILDTYTNEPVDGLYLMFGVASGSGFFGSYEKNKYSAITDENGYLEFEPVKNDISHTFYISNDYYAKYPDSMSSAATHILDYSIENNTHLNYGDNKTIYYKPSGVVEFFIDKQTIDQLDFDTIIVKSKYEEQIISFICDYEYVALGTENQFYVEPSQIQKFEIYRIDNGNRSLYDVMEFFVCNYNTFYEDSYGCITKMEILKKQ